MNALMEGTSLLYGESTIPGVEMPKELVERLPETFQACDKFGLDYPDVVIEMLDFDGMSEIAAYGGFPKRYPHWSFGMQYEELSRTYEYGLSRIYEMVVNCQPCYIYCLNSNTILDNVMVIAHATAHADFFKNNIYFQKTSQNMMNELASHGTRIRRYMSEWGRDKVEKFIDMCLMIQTLIDPAKAYKKRRMKNPLERVRREFIAPRRIKVDPNQDYLESWINTPEWMEKEKRRIEEEELKGILEIFEQPTRDIMGYMKDHAPLQPWQQDIISMLYEERMYFAPQGQTKVLNEGWASRADSQIMAVMALAKDVNEAFNYAHHKAGVLGGKRSMNPYKLGYQLLLDAEERWNKGRFGEEYDKCTNMVEKRSWDKKLGLGHQKIFELRKYYDDVTLINEFFTPEFCNKNEFFRWTRLPNGEYVIAERDPAKIKKMLMRRHINMGLPDIQLVDPNYKDKRIMFLEHNFDGRTLDQTRTLEVLKHMSILWRGEVYLASKDKNGDEILFMASKAGVTIEKTDR